MSDPVSRPNRPRAARFGLLLAAASVIGVSGCNHPREAWRALENTAAARPLGRPEELLRRVLDANDGYGTLSGRIDLSLEIELGEYRSEKLSASGLVRVRRPGHLRFELRDRTGELLLDMIVARGKSRAREISPRLYDRRSALVELAPVIAEDLRLLFRLDPRPNVTRVAAEETVSLASGSTPLFEIREYGPGEEAVRRMTVFASSLAIARMEIADDVGERTVTFGDHETNGRVAIPRSYHLARVGTYFYWLAFTLESFEIDAGLGDSVFDPAGSG
jgi:hypothetical protein